MTKMELEFAVLWMDIHHYLKQKTLKTTSTVSQLLWNSLAKWIPHYPPMTGSSRRLKTMTQISYCHKQSGTALLHSCLVMSNVGINAVQHRELKLQFGGTYALKYVFLYCNIRDHSLSKAPPCSRPPKNPAHAILHLVWELCSGQALSCCNSTDLQTMKAILKEQEIRLGQSSVSLLELVTH